MGVAARIALPSLTTLAKGSADVKVRCSAIAAIASAGGNDEKLIALLKELVKDEDQSVRAAARKALSFLEVQRKKNPKDK
jgi:HEAT repeat protein